MPPPDVSAGIALAIPTAGHACSKIGYHYIRSAHSYKVIAHNQEFGKNAIAGALYVRKDSGITELSQLRGRTIIFGGGKDAMLSYIAPRFLMMRAGLKESDFRSEFAVNPPNALLASRSSTTAPAATCTGSLAPWRRERRRKAPRFGFATSRS